MSYVPSSGPVKVHWGVFSDCNGEAYCEQEDSQLYTNDPSRMAGIFSGTGVACCSIRHVTDGTSNTFLLLERRGELCVYPASMFSYNWQGAMTGMKPNSPNLHFDTDNDETAYRRNGGASSHHAGGVHAAMADGGVRFISNNINFVTYNSLGGKSDGQVVGEY